MAFLPCSYTRETSLALAVWVSLHEDVVNFSKQMTALRLNGDLEKHMYLPGALFSFLDLKWHASYAHGLESWRQYRHAQEAQNSAPPFPVPQQLGAGGEMKRRGHGRFSHGAKLAV